MIIYKQAHTASKEKICRATAGFVSLMDHKAVIDISGFPFPPSLSYFLCFPARTSASCGSLSDRITQAFLKCLSPQLSCIFFFPLVASFLLTITVVLGNIERYPQESPMFQK